jgi:hypothetical protein
MPQTRSTEMELGTEEVAEVWFMPSNSAAYSPRTITVCASVEVAHEYIATEAARYAGTLEIVRVTTTRQRVA